MAGEAFRLVEHEIHLPPREDWWWRCLVHCWCQHWAQAPGNPCTSQASLQANVGEQTGFTTEIKLKNANWQRVRMEGQAGGSGGARSRGGGRSSAGEGTGSMASEFDVAAAAASFFRQAGRSRELAGTGSQSGRRRQGACERGWLCGAPC